MEMTRYAKYRILLFSLELTGGKFLRVDNLEDSCSAIEAKAVFDEMRRTADVVDVGEGAGHRLSLVQEIDSFECRGIPREFRLGLGIAGHLPNGFLHRAFRLLATTFDPILVHLVHASKLRLDFQEAARTPVCSDPITKWRAGRL